MIVPGRAASLRPMPEFLSDGWFHAMADAARAATGVPADLDLVIQQVVDDVDDERGAWYVAVRDGSVRLERGRHPAPSITFTLDLATARGIQAGTASAQGAFMAGRLRVGGDVRVLLDQQYGLQRLDDVFAEVRSTTTSPQASGDGAG